MQVYDVVVVGAGSAGATLAAQLSEDPGSSVLLIEAGVDHGTRETPSAIHGVNFLAALGEPGRIWPNLAATRAEGQAESLYVRGRGAGGSSSVNGMLAIRGIPDDYERWETEYGCRGWGWSEMRAAFLRVEDDAEYGGDENHGRGGPIPLTRLPLAAMAPLDRALRDALGDLGYPTCDDYHAPDATGISRGALTLRNGRRVSTNDAYLEAARSRPNLAVQGDTLVDRVVFDGRRAIGVRTATGDEIGAREVIVSAGAIHSPALLLRSGVGGADGLPVGANLKEHAMTPGFEIALRPEAQMPSADTSMISSCVRYTSGLADAGPNDMQLLWFGAIGAEPESCRTGRLLGAVMRVFSSGEIRLRSDDPHVDPVVEFRLLSDDRDRVRLRDCVQRMIEVVQHPTMRGISDGVLALTTPIDDLGTDDAIDAWLSANVTDYVHAAGTCRMGSNGDPAAVVDTECRVLGYEQLRVCDASVMPDIPRANTHLTTVAIADRLVHRMREARAG